MADDGSQKLRLDQLLVEQGVYPSRARARDAVARGEVTVNGRTIDRPGQIVRLDAKLATTDPARGYVSRSALKLKAALDAFHLDVTGKACLDIGASTGGFTQVLLQAGARHVTAIDVGHGQLDAAIAFDQRVTSIEGLNARDLDATHLAYAPEVVVADVSFISLKLALPAALGLAAPAAMGIFLVKPQFEVGRDHVGKGGLVRDQAIAQAAVNAIAAFLETSGWRVTGRLASPIAGGDGNQEYVLAAIKA
jgi:23S rRNA (cytidine1920-2'-O)/16S rRNA (cytidine1409-2'-O)-methyltransferase